VLAGETPVLVHNANCWSATRRKPSVENAFGHWQKHKSEFPNLNNAKEYVEAATKFLRSADPNVLTRTRPNGDVIRFNPATDEFGVMDPSGVPRTYFKPDPASHGYPTNMDYFNAQ
jgi:pyocin large subunit-like protein